jgi:hypothetical protein
MRQLQNQVTRAPKTPEQHIAFPQGKHHVAADGILFLFGKMASPPHFWIPQNTRITSKNK